MKKNDIVVMPSVAEKPPTGANLLFVTQEKCRCSFCMTKGRALSAASQLSWGIFRMRANICPGF